MDYSLLFVAISFLIVLITSTILLDAYLRARQRTRFLTEIITLTQFDLNEPIPDETTPPLPLHNLPETPEPAYLRT